MISNTIAGKEILAGSMATSGGVMASLVVFNDKAYLYLAVAGAFLSMFGVLHELANTKSIQRTRMMICAQLCKGLIMGVLSVPFWFLLLDKTGDQLLESVFGIKVGGLEESIWMIVSFGLTWYAVPVYDWAAGKVKKVFK